MLKRLIMNDEGMVRSPAAYAMIALAVLIVGVFAYRAWTADQGPMRGTWICWECGRVDKVTPSLDMRLPGKCPKCDQQSFVPAYLCPRCKAPVALNEYRGLKPPTKCPKCGAEVRHGS